MWRLMASVSINAPQELAVFFCLRHDRWFFVVYDLHFVNEGVSVSADDQVNAFYFFG